MARGIVKWFNIEKGFGFIIPDEGGNDVFVHASALGGGSIKEDDVVSYDMGSRNSKSCAINVKKV